MENRYIEIGKEFKRHLEDTETSKLSHWHAAEVYEKRDKWWLGIPTTVSAIILSWLLIGRIENFFEESTVSILRNIVPLFLSLFVAIMSALNTFLNFNDKALQHRMAAQKYHALWRLCRNWKTDFPDSSFNDEAVKTVRIYRDRLNEINHDSPQIPKWAWKSVEKQKKEGSTTYDTIKKKTAENRVARNKN